MSTPINQLPPPDKTAGAGAAASASASSKEDDQYVNDVISEMEREFSGPSGPVPPSPPPPPMPQYIPAIPPPSPMNYNTPIPPHHGHGHGGSGSGAGSDLFGINKNNAQIAILAAAVAYVLFYPIDTDFLYEKYAFLSALAPYDKVIRTFLLAILFYVLLWKFA